MKVELDTTELILLIAGISIYTLEPYVALKNKLEDRLNLYWAEVANGKEG